MKASITSHGELPLTEPMFDELRQALFDAVETAGHFPAQVIVEITLKGVRIEKRIPSSFSWTL